MSDGAAGAVFIAALALALAVAYKPLGDYMYRVVSSTRHLWRMAGLAVRNFVSAGVGIAVAVAMVRGFARDRTARLGNFWVDLTRIVVRILLPLSMVAAIVLISGGAIQNLSAGHDVHTLA